ncbi:GntR family transcriptional regulator [Clostridium grantii]|uniref:GntR family transcriptional regulator n=1 Tax=Clostridium grantii DSM 8605 TaxID=1121316 RepID=A0A1M5QFE7_9CLOT|nr:GntR family transcriptional regulator [Clostridium grantii]SHH12925.1 GntR family transcriptional regulator [Clostridium grantii DSM 8605]
MNIFMDHTSDLPMYEQIKLSIKESILSGNLKYNDSLPSVRQLAKELNVSTITTKRAYLELERENLIYSISGRGTFVNNANINSLIKEKNLKLIEEYKISTLELMKSGLEKKDIIDIIEKIYKGDL